MAFAALVVASFAAALVVVDFVIPVEVVVAREVAVVLVALVVLVVAALSKAVVLPFAAVMAEAGARFHLATVPLFAWVGHPRLLS